MHSLYSTAAVAFAFALAGTSQAQDAFFNFDSPSDGGAWDATFNEPSVNGDYFFYQGGPNSEDSVNGYIMQLGNINLKVFRNDPADPGPTIDIHAAFSIHDAAGADQDFVVNSVDWRNVFDPNDPTATFGHGTLRGRLDGATVWETSLGMWQTDGTTLVDGEANTFRDDATAQAEVANLDQTIDQIVIEVLGYEDNTWPGIEMDNLDISLITSGGGLSADFNSDGTVDLLDLDILGANWQMSGTASTGDANGDGTVDLLDLDVLGAEWQMSASFESALAASGIPEPGSLALLGLGALGVLRRRK